MGFVNSLYEADSGDIFKIRLSDDTLAGTTTPPATPANFQQLPFVKVSKTNREFGLRPRIAVYAFEETTASGLTATAYRRVPLLVPNVAPAIAITVAGRQYNLRTVLPEDR